MCIRIIALKHEVRIIFRFTVSHRLRIKASPGKRRPPRDSPATKRSRSDKSPKVSSTSAGYIQIVDVDPNGRYIQINNTSDKVCLLVYVCFI